MEKDKISIILLHYNEPQLTLRCLKSLEKLTYKNIEIILVDNGSREEISTFIKNVPRNLKVIRNKNNLGYAEGNNVGYKIATGKYILLLNNDAIVTKNFLEPLLKKLKSEKDIAAVQPKIMQYPRKEYIDSVGSYFIPSGFLYHFGHNKKDKTKFDESATVFSMKGACMLFKKEVLQKTGLFDPDYFAYFEETDLCQRIWMAGYKLVYTPDSFIYHEGGQTSNKLPSAFVQYNSYKNRIFTYCKNFETVTLLKVLPIHILLCEVVTVLYAVTGKFTLAWCIQRALWWNLKNISRIKKERKKIKKLRKVKDSEYLPSITRNVRLSYYYHLFSTSLAGYED